MKKGILLYVIIVAVIGCTATFISVRKSDNTTISTDASRDSTAFDLGNWSFTVTNVSLKEVL